MRCFSWRALHAPVLMCVLLLNSCRHSGLPAIDSRQYSEFVSAFYVGLAGLQTGEDVRAKERLTQATQLAPGEPAAWANLALFSVRQGDLDTAYDQAEKARSLAPKNSRIEELLGAIEAKRGKLPEAIEHLKKAVHLDANNLKAPYALAEQTERLASPAADAEAQKLLEKLVTLSPDNVAVQVEIVRLAAKRMDSPALQSSLARLEAESKNWPPEAQQRLAVVRQTANGPNPSAAAVQASFLRNVLARVPAYRSALEQVKTPVTFVGDPLIRFVNLPTPESRPAPPDTSLSFTVSGEPGQAPVTMAKTLTLDTSGQTFIAAKTGGELRLEGGAQLAFAGSGTTTSHGVLAADLNYDFKTDLVLANESGVRVYLQRDPNHFDDITERSKIPEEVVKGSYTGAWAFDIDLDGDLDVILGTRHGEPVILRNNGDSTFAVIRSFRGIDGLTAFASADMDGDGDPDVLIIDGAGAAHLFMNERLGEFRERKMPPAIHSGYVDVAGADLNGDTLPDFILLGTDGSVDRISEREDTRGLSVEQMIRPGGARLDSATATLGIADFDNNGGFDVLAGSRLFLSDGRNFQETRLPAGLRISGLADLNNDGRLDLIAINQSGQLVTLLNHGTKNYHWQTIRVRAANGHGDQRINSFGVGGDVEIRSALLTQRQTITAPVLHFGLGEHTQTDVARIVWPNGSVQAEFELKPDLSILAEQRLKGSCPSLFAWNGHEMKFVKDAAPWSPALGLHINAQTVANIQQTEEWFKLPGDAVVPRSGYYDLRVTDELWEAFYIDHYSLRAIDHPEGTEIFTDERFSIPPPPLKVATVSQLHPFASAHDDRGHDVSAVVSKCDRNYLDTFDRGRYQGVTRDHWVELELPESAPRNSALYLLASGWLHPTDATVNIALSQNSDQPPQSLRIEVADRAGKWIVVKRDLGFLAGKLKTAVIDLNGIFPSGAPRKLRLGTNMEIYWDQLAWAERVSDAETHATPLTLTRAELRYRGFSAMHSANQSSPEIPDYDVHGSAPRWRDLEGYYTRYGDVRELLRKVDDRYVIQNAGDELQLEFAAIAPPPKGWTRDFVMVGDGWVKDGDYNSVFSKTVMPLPFHAMKSYTQAPGSLEQDPAYRLHPADWDFFQTRYITPRPFIQALWN